METEPSAPGSVKRYDEKNAPKGSGNPLIDRVAIKRRQKIYAHEIRDRRTFGFFLRAQGYLHGAFIRKSHNRLGFLDWNNARFCKKARGDYSLKTIERQFPRFQRWCEEYVFEKVRTRDPKTGRSVWVVRCFPNLGVRRAVPGATIRERFEAAIRAHVAKAGRTKVDRGFCRKFADLSGLPLVAVETIWLRVKKLDGLKCRWRGEGRGRKICVELPGRWPEVVAERAAERAARKNENLSSRDPQTPAPVSIYFVNERPKNSRPVAEAVQTESARALPARGKAANAAKAGHEHPDGIRPPDVREQSGAKPLQICGRFVSSRKLLALAQWLAVARLKFAHVNRERVVWRFAHARNFANAALRFGYAVPAVESAYSLGVDRSHNDALERDRLPGGGYASQREPSAAVVYAWQNLRGSDPRSPEELWAEFFAASRRGPLAPIRTADGRAAKKSGSGEKGARLTAAQAAEKLRELRAVIAKPTRTEPGEEVRAAGLTLGQLAEFLRECGDGATVAKFNAQARPWRRYILEKAREWIAAKKRAADRG